MTPHPYIYEKLMATHQAQIRHDIQQSRVQAHARHQRTFMQSTVGKVGTLLIELGSHLQRTGQQSGAPIHSS